jgi:TPR repeat protein
MSRLIFLTLLLFANEVFANSILQQQLMEQNKQVKEDKSLTFIEQKQLIDTLESQIKENKYTNAYELALIYEDGVIDVNNKKTPNMRKAVEYFILGYKHKDYRTAFKLVPLLLKKGETNKALEIVQEAINNTRKKRSLLTSLVTIHASMVLDYFPFDSNKFVDALYNISMLNKKELNETPTLKFIQANLMNVIGDRKKAEQILNEACNASNAPEGLKKICFNTENFLIAKDGVEKSIDECTTCDLYSK